jgi:hypothetical protein
MTRISKQYKQSFIVASTASSNQEFAFARLRYKTDPSQKIRLTVSHLGFKTILTDADDFVPHFIYLDGINSNSTTSYADGTSHNMWLLGSADTIGVTATDKFAMSSHDVNSITLDDLPYDYFKIVLKNFDGVVQDSQIIVTFNIDILEE